MAAKEERIGRMLSAMQLVYNFPETPNSGPWTPPPLPEGHHGRYLWTDTFGVLNFLTLYGLTSNTVFLDHAKTLIRAVHDTLGKTRDLSRRLRGASSSNPLGGGLRIGKKEAEGPDADGQYHHYLVRWMFALNRLSILTNEKKWNDYAIACAQAIHPAFVYDVHQFRPKMYWKMSVDLREPIHKSEGNLDPLDGLVVFKLLQNTHGKNSKVLAQEIEHYQRIADTKWEAYISSEPMELGLTLWIAHWFEGEDGWSVGLMDLAEANVDKLLSSTYFEGAMSQRLALREFGLAVGMRCALGRRDPAWNVHADKIVQNWERAGLVPEPTDNYDLGINAMPGTTGMTNVMYSCSLVPGVLQAGFCSGCPGVS